MAGSLAAAGVGLFARQTITSLVDDQGAVTAGYWTAILWKTLMGDEVFRASSSSDRLRVYAHGSTNSDSKNLTALLINTDSAPLTTTVLPATEFGICKEQAAFHVTAGPAAGVLINGERPAFASAQSAKLPTFLPEKSSCGEALTVAAHSFSFLRVSFF